MLGNEKLLFDELYEKTKDCGRVQFVKLLMTKEKENQELKLELSGYRQAILEDKDMLGLKEESEELKKQLEEYKATNKILSHELTKDKVLQQDCLTTCCGIPIGDIPKLITQQKEFIEYLEDLIKQNETVVEVSKYGLPKNCSKLLIDFYKEILSKYKEIIGGKE